MKKSDINKILVLDIILFSLIIFTYWILIRFEKLTAEHAMNVIAVLAGMLLIEVVFNLIKNRKQRENAKGTENVVEPGDGSPFHTKK